MNYKITASIVLYQNERNVLTSAIKSFLKTDIYAKLYLIDNSPTDDLKDMQFDARTEYIFNPSNPGFGAAHNMAIKQAINEGSMFHFIINPDVHFETDIITPMINFMAADVEIGMMMPQVLNLDGTVQHLPKLLPSPFSILLRKFKKPSSIYNEFIKRYELRDVPQDQVYNAPILSGCFTLLNLKAIAVVGLYDDRFFMYFEDWDLSRRMHLKYKTIYFPKVSVYHGYESGANKSSKLFKVFLKSAFAYFNKWGWFFDKQRTLFNKKTLNQFGS